LRAVRLITFLIAVAFAGALAGCGGGESESNAADSTATDIAGGTMESDAENVGQAEGQQPEEDDDEEDSKKREKSTSVEAAKAFRGDLIQPVVAEGTIRARNSAEISSEIAGRVVRVHAVEGQQLRRNQLIASLDAREYEAAMEEARARYLQALSLLSIEQDDLDISSIAQEVRDEFANLDKLERQGKISREERIAREVEADLKAIGEGKFRYEVAAARSGVSEARASLERARINLEQSEIRAPFAGTITGLTLSPGEHLTANQTICTLVDDVNLEAEVGVLEADLAFVTKGKAALIEVPALDQTYPVTVDVVSPRFDRETRTCEVLLRLRNEDGRLRPGMFVRAQIAGRTFEDRLLVPREAILTRDGRPLLFKVEGDRAKWLYVKLGENNDYLVEIERVLQGGSLEPDDRVVVSDHLTLAHDAKIKVKKTVSVSDPWVAANTEAE
jgi:RND family efflux transporter MFP subunit